MANNRSECLRGLKELNQIYFSAEDSEGFFQIPIIHRENYIPKELIGFNQVKSSTSVKDKVKFIHCFLDDIQLQRLWNKPEVYFPMIARFDGFMSPDFSLYADMPIATQIWNTFRNRLIGQAMQFRGIIVIPTISWSTEESFKFCFLGVEKHGTVAVSTNGNGKTEKDKMNWLAGMKEMINRLEPETILIYGNPLEFSNEEDRFLYAQHLIFFKNEIIERCNQARLKNKQKGMEVRYQI